MWKNLNWDKDIWWVLNHFLKKKQKLGNLQLPRRKSFYREGYSKRNKIIGIEINISFENRDMYFYII